MKSLFDQNAYTEIKERIGSLDETSQGLWGKMNVAQMCAHCQGALEIPLEHRTLKKPNPLKKMLFKTFKASMYNDKPWKKNLPTVKDFVVSNSRDFGQEKQKLLGLIDEFYSQRDRQEWNEHPMFGRFTVEQMGMVQYKHLDHHLKQFGA